MRKIFWYLYTRLRLWYLYRGRDIPYSEEFTPYNCPCCSWDPEDYYFTDYYLGSHSHHFGYEGRHDWIEKWKCPRCGTKFEVDNSD